MTKRQLKRVLALVAAAVFVFAVSGCSGTDSGKTAEKKSASVGQWVTTMKVSAADKKAHKVKFRVTKVVRDQKKVSRIIDDYNSSAKGQTVDTSAGSDDLEYCAAYYQVKYPAGFPAKEWGISDVTLDFSITGLDGGTVSSGGTKYEGIGDTVEIGNEPEGYDFYPPKTYKGKFVFLMVKGDSDYLFKTTEKKGDKTYVKYIRGK